VGHPPPGHLDIRAEKMNNHPQMEMPPPQIIAGVPKEREDFEQRNRLFLERYSNLLEALNIAFIRTFTQSEPIDKFVFGYGRLCCEDFSEVLLMSANGYGVGATKLLRTLYEHAVTLYYLSEHPDELNNFWDYSYVTEHKLLKPIRETFGSQAFENTSIRETEIEERFSSVKERFMITDCKKCGSKRLNHTWNKLDFVAMAKQAGSLGALIVPGYYGPLTQAHSHFASLASRLTILENGGISFVPDAQRKVSDTALITAHNVILQVLEVQNKQFKIQVLQEKLRVCRQDFIEIWKNRKIQD
jgi:hypothetical protein